MKEKNQNEELNTKKKGKSINKKVVAIGTTAILALATIVGVYVASRNSNTLESLSPEIARSMEYEQVQDGDENLEETNNVKFDAFFLRDLNGDGVAEGIRGTCNEIGEESTLYMELNVRTEGYLKDGKITINSDNFYLQTNLPKDEELADNYIGNNIKEIRLNQINNGTQKLITGIVRSGDYTYTSGKADAIGSNVNNYSKVNSVTLTGTYVTASGEEIPIEKKVDFNVDWHGRTSASISSTYQSKYIEDLIDEENGKINLTFTVNTNETRQELLLGKNHTEVEIPELNDYAPLEVVYTGSNATVNYNEETRILTLDRTSSLGEDGTVKNKLSTQNSYSIKVTYPLEAYTSLGVNSVQLKIPVSTYYEGYNNTNEEFTNPYVSNTAKATIIANFQKYQGTQSRFDITVGTYVSSPTYRYIVSKQKPLRLYNGQSEEEFDDTYIVKWQAYIGTNSDLGNIVMKETSDGAEQVVDQFIKSDSTQESMEDVTTNVGIYFSGADRMLGTDGYINVYDEETDNLLVTFTSSDWNRYTSSNPYRYETSVKHIRVETSNIVENDAYFYVYNVKELDDEKILEKYEKEQFDELDYIKSNLVGYVGGQYVETDTHQANYEAPFSIATISIRNNTISTQATEENDIITIRAFANTSSNQVGWVNGSFLVKLPDEMLTAELNSVEINNSNVSLESYELVEEDGQKFIKIVTKNDREQTYDIKIDVDLTPDPRIATTSRNIELYASNENGNDYYYTAQDRYDVNNDLNTEELVNYRTTSISMVSPNSLLTNQTASEYDDKGSMVISPQIADIKPVYAVVDQEQEEQTVKIGVQIKNNYASTISEIQILGKIPFEGNTYVLSGGDLGSTFTTKMVDTGIDIPQELLDTATIYYSTNENPDRDLSNGENGWQTAEEVTNWDEIKTFLIDLGDYVMPTGKEYVFYYTVKIPNGLEFNQTAFSHHGIYFSLDTEDGKYRTQTEPNKLGFRIAEKYNLELSKFQTGKDKLVPGATYSIQEVITNDDGTESYGEAKTGVTNSEGKLTIRNLYAEKTYELKEIKTPDNYELNSNVIRFIGHVDEQGILTVEKTGETREDPEVIKNDGEEYKVALQVEDEIKASLKLIKKEQGTDTLLYGVKYKITGYGLPEEGKTIRTNTRGEASLNGLSINQEYTLEEVKADGYYLASPIKFKILNNNGRYEIQVTEGTVLEQNIAEENDIPVVSFTLEDEKIPTYNLQLFKIKKTTESTVNEDELIAKAETSLADTEVVPLANATFKLFKGDEELGKYTTNEQGLVTIEGLYQYESEKDIDQTYTLKEVMSPEGYAKVQDISFRVQKDEETNQLILIDENNVDRKYTVDGSTVTLTIEDSPSFKLIKKDAETKQALANIKFAIYDDNSEPARNSKGEIVGTKETINGREYYTVQTNNNGELTVDLPEGLYKAVEVQAPEQYDLSNQTYYFGIGASRPQPTGHVPTQAMSIGGSDYDEITTVAATSDGGYIAGGYFGSSSIKVGNYTLTNASSSSHDGMVIKYGAEGEVEWAKSIGGSSLDEVSSVAVTEEGEIVVGGYFGSDKIELDESYILTNAGSSYTCDGMVIKYSRDGEVEWARSIGGSSSDYIESVAVTEEGEIVVGGCFHSSITVGDYPLTNAGTFSDGMVIKYGADGTVQWATSIGGTSSDYIDSVTATSDGGILVGGRFRSSNITVDGIELRSNGDYDGMVIKYGVDGTAEWANAVGGSDYDYINSVAQTEDGDYIVGGFFQRSITVDGIELKNNGYYDGIIIKYGAKGEVKWVNTIGGIRYDMINSVTETQDGGFIVGGYFSKNITVDGIELRSNGDYDGMVIKYGVDGTAEWAKVIGGSDADNIYSVAETHDGDYIVGGRFEGDIKLDRIELKSNGNYEGMVIKYEQVDLNDPTTIQATSVGGDYSDQITTVTATSDGGYIAGGYFESPNIIVGEYILSNNSDYNVIDGDITDGMVIKYGADGSVQWATSIGGGSGDYINSVAESSDGGILVGGDFKSSSITVGEYTLTNSRGQDGMIIKYGADGSVEWATSLGGDYATKINSVTETRDGGIVVGGLFTSSSITVGDYTLTNAGSGDGIVIKYGVDGKVEWSTSIGGTGSDYIQSVASTSDGGIVVGGRFTSSSITVGDYNLTNAEANQSYPGEDGMVIKYGADGSVQWATSIGESDYDYIESVSETSDGEIIVGGYFRSSSITVGDYTLTNAGSYDGMVIKFGADGEVEWATRIGGDDADYIYSVAATSDGGYIVGGYFSSSSITVGNYTLTNARGYDEMVIKYDSDGEVEWAKSIGGSNYDYISAVTELNDASVIAGGYFFSSTIETDGHILTKNGSSDGMLLKIVNMTGVPEVQELTVENERKEFKITTEVNEIDGVKGGSISGEDLNPYETVKYGDNSTKEIIMTPDPDYEIVKITVNGEDYPFEANSDGTFTMPQFTNVTENIHVEVTYMQKDHKLVISKADEHTGEALEGARFKLTQTESEDASNLYETIVTTDEEGKAIVQLPFGTYQITEIESPYGYETIEEPITLEFTSDGEHEITIQNKELQKVIVHHYLKDTDGTLTTTKVAEDEILLGKEGEEYRTTPHLDLEKYELEKDEEGNYVIPEDANGTFDGDVEKDQEIIYYYKTKDYPLIVHHYIEGTTNPVPLRDGSLAPDEARTGKEGEEYSTKAITPEELDDKYELVEIPSNAIGIFGTEEIVVTYEYRLKQEKLIIKKQNADGQGLEGATLVIENTDNGTRRTGITDENGKINIDFPIGNVVITETKAPDGYKLLNEPIETVVELDKDNVVTIVDEKINYFDLTLNKINIETKEPIAETEFQLTYTTQYGEERVENYVTAEDGTIKIQGLEDEIEYTLQETKATKGYVTNNQIYKFIIHYENGVYNVEVLDGQFESIEGENNQITLTIGNNPTLKIIKQGEFGELLANAKFTITDEEGKEVVDGNGNEVGQVENIDGKDLRVVTTDAEGKITENLEPGTYILTEVQAPNGYKLPENEEDRVTRIEITSEGHTGNNIEKENEIILANLDMSWLDTNKLQLVGEIVAIDDQGNLELAGGLVENFTIPAEYTTTEEAITLEKNSMADGIILTINQEGKVVKAKQVTSPENGGNMLYYTMTNKNGDVLGLGILIGELTIPAEETEKNEAITVSGTGSQDIYTICFNKEGKVKWVNNISYIEINNLMDMGFKNNEFVIQYTPNGDTVTIPSDSTETGEEIVINMTNNGNPVMIIYNEEGKVSRAMEITAPNIDYEVSTVAIGKDGGVITTAYSEEPIIFDGSETVSGEEIQVQGGITIKYNQAGKVEWATSISGMSAIGLMKEVSNGYVGLMAYMGEIKVESKDTSSGEEITLDSQSNSDISTALIKYNAQGQVEWIINIDFNINSGSLMPLILQETVNGYSLLDSDNGKIYTFTETPTDLIANQQSLVTITNEAMESSVVVHHYIEGTTDKLSEDVLVNGKVGSDYTTNVATDIPANYELVAEPTNKNGKITPEQTEVIYYYRIKDAGIEQTIDKTGTDKITNEDQKVEYTITYTGKVTDYIGKATVTITDTLPYEIDEARSSLDGGLYNDAQKTITWTIDVDDIDTYTKTESGNISITKQISVVYENMDYSKTSFENKVQGSIYLEETEQEEPTNEDTVVTQTEFTTNVTVTKVWNHTNNIYTIPTQVEVQVKNGEDVVSRQIINSSNKVGEDDNTWSYTFTGLPKYDNEGSLINYTVDEAEVNSGDLAYYDKNIEGNTITNTYDGPIISAVKESTTADEERGYVIEGETITYTITVTNEGGRDKVVTVQDTVPEGTTFREGSIKVNGSGADNYTEANLNNGIQVNVPADGTTTVSFEVTVNPLQGEDLEALTKVIRNTAVIDGKDTDEVTDTVNKSKITFNKTSESENRLDYVVEGEKITYTINLSNEGTAPATTLVKDSSPEGTAFTQGSIVVKVDNVQINTDKTYTEEELEQGISVEVPAGKSASVSFQVTVNNLNDGTLIKNKATVGDSEEPNTNETEDKYVEPIISSEKTVEIEHQEVGYALEGETIKYTITVTNNGGLSKDVIIKDTVPEGTTFVPGSIEVNGSGADNYTETNLNSGIEVNVPAKEGTVAGTVSVSFEVRVNALESGFTKVIENTAEVDGTPTDEVEVTVNKPNVIASKESTPASGEKVKAGQEITYRIVLDNTQGTAPGTVKVQDTIPTGTTYKDNSIMLDGKPIENDETDLANGLNVTVPAGEQSILSFTVTVNDLSDGTEIRNVANVNDTPTEEIIHTYVEPIIDGEKSISTENDLDYAVEGEKITYTITVRNDGGLDGNAIIKDTAPTGTTFVPGSIKVNGLPTQDTEDNLKDGITVNVPAKQGDSQGTATVSFDVTVNPLEGEDLANLSKEILNTAFVDDNPTNEVTETVNKADVKYSKSSIPDAGSTVTANNEITYIITLDNSRGKAPATVVVKDTIPEGTTFVAGSIKVKDSSTGNSAEELASGIEVNLKAGESTTLEFKVTVNDLDDEDQIRNIATVDENPTKETIHTYVEPIISATKTQTTENSLGYVVEGEKITYTITVTNNGGLDGNAIVKDVAPEGTTFVDGSIKVNGSGDDNYTETDLNTGIEVKVPAHGNTILSFEVTVDELPEDTYEYIIRNIATVDEEDTNEVTTTVNKPNVIGTKESTPASGETVENGEEITYTIRLTNNGTAPDTVTVKDSIPTGTEFITGSIKVGSEARPELTEDHLSNGIDVTVEAENTNTLEFKVKVVDNDTLENGNKITNTATVNDTPTNETEHTYIEPIIDATKVQTTQNSLDYVVEGEVITYTITVTNTGNLGKDVTVRDNIPDGTSFVPDSIVIVENGTPKQGTFTESNLEDGIEVNVGAQNTTTITFQVTVDELPQGIYQEEIVNAAVVDEEQTNDVRVDVYKPHMTATKEAEPEKGTRLTANDPITYTITIRNDGRTDGTTTVKDTIPEGTTFVPGSIKVAGESRAELTQENLSQGINVEVPVGEETTVEFQVTVNDLDNGEKIKNVATYTDEDEKEISTEEVEHTYIEPIISSTKESETENGLGYVVEGETITYTITVSNTGDLGKEVTIQDQIPEGTTFVEQSIKVNGEARTELTQENLSQGIQEFVNARGEITVSFDVTVDALPEGTLRKEITNTAVVDNDPTDPVTDIVNKADVKGEKSSVPPSGETVEAGEEITYTITVSNDGTAPETAIVKDTIPEGTTFVDGSIVVEGSQETYELADLTTNGIEVPLNPDESKTVEFKVKVQDIDNGTKIRNVATVDDEPTNNTEHTYVEPIISGSKSFETENGLDYVVEGETITYIITATNTGDAEGTIKVSDQIPEGTTFVPESITVGEEARTELTQDNLQEGIDVTVPARGETTVSFKVTVNDLPEGTYEDTIENTAIVNGTETNEVTEEVHKPNIKATKESNPESGAEVTAGNTITYTINLSNQGTAPGEVVVKDEIPEGTTFVAGSIKVGGQSQASSTAEDLANGITVQLNADESTTVEFKVTVNDLENGTPIRNIASTTNPKESEDIPTNEVTHEYVEPIISQEKSATTEKGLDYVGEGEKITYTITVKNDGDLSKNVQIQDTIPEGTSFVEGSIKENDSETQYTATDLENGIEVNVPEHEEITVSFEVTVNDLPEGKYEETIRNTAYIDGVPTNEVTKEVNKAHVRIGKTSEPASGERVTANDEIKYVIVLENKEGTAPITLQVKDSIPEGTTFVANSIRVNNTDLDNTLEDLTTNGISVLVPAGEARTVEFKVRVNDLDNGYIIRNKANITNPETEESKDTNEVTHEYVEAVIEAEKEQETERGLSYVIPGEKITYTIRINNTGDLSKTVLVKDSIPEGTEFVEGSVLLNGKTSNASKEDLEKGIQVEATGNAEQTISFQVTVLDGATDVRNSAIVDGEDTNETKVPVLSYEKTAEVIRQTTEEIADGAVTAGDKIKYTIKVNNLGEEPVTDVTVKDVIPTGTTLSSTSTGAKVNDKNEITWTIDSIAVGESKEVGFEVTVNYDVVDSKNITNVATVDGENTNETETPYEKPEIKEESTIEKTGTEIINSTEDSITYEISYNASIKDFVGEGKVTLVDYLPYEIDVENQYLDGGFYDSKTKTITWEEDLGAIDTYTNGDKEVNIEKEITVKYLYGEDAETLEGTIPNRVEGTLQLTQKDPENPTQDKTVLEDKKETTFETKVQIPTYIIVHHYIEGTNTKVPSKVYGEVVQDETQEGFVGQDYTTSASNNVQENYKVVSNSNNTTGTMTRTPIEVIYYYRLQPGNIVTNTITKDGTDKIINKDDKVIYTINYTGRITNYVGNAKVEIIDYLPFAIDEAVSNLAGGLYNPTTHTITWVEDLGRINTYTNPEQGNISITKNIEVVFTEMDYTGTSFINRAQGKITLEETDQEQETPEAEKVTETEFVKDVTVEKVWDDNEDIKGKRPESVTVQLTASGKVVDNVEDITTTEGTTDRASIENGQETSNNNEYKVILNAENNWRHTFQDLPKYTKDGQEINYSVIETETNKDDLEYYEEPDIQVFNTDTTVTVRVTNSYKLMETNLDTKIEKTGTELITSSTQEVSYNIKYNATVKDYIGASLVTITDYLPYAIDVEKSNLDGGTYDPLTNTIVWTENIDHINTYENGDYPVSIEKNISVVFTNLDATAKAMVNRVTGRIDLYENETTNTVETTYETKIEIPGNVAVKYVDKDSGKEIAEGYELEGLAGDPYSTEQKEIYGYTYVENTNNTSGNMIEGTIEVIYYYERTNAGGVIVHYVDEDGNKLADDVTISGKVQDPYKTEQKDIPNYDFVRVEGETEGELVEGTIEVTYIYKKIPAKVIVQYLEKDDTPDDNTDNVVLAPEETIEGFSGDTYNTERVEIENYKPADPEPENSTGTMTKEDIYVTYYYERKPSGIVTVKYVDVDTNEEILHKVQTEDGEEYTSYREQMSGLCGLEYTTQAKDIPYYNFVEELRPSNATGVYTEEDIEVIYYYRKQTFNLSVNKQIDKITVNGVEHSLKEDLNQIDVVASKVQETDIVVTYKIIVSNPSEIEGTALVVENIPDFFRVADGTASEWTQTANKTLEAEVTLQPGETKELIVVLNWIKNSSNFGLQINTVTLQKVTNPANYEETDLSDNTSTAEVIFSVKTGGIDTSIVIGTALIVMLGALIITIYLKEKQNNN